MEVVPARQWLVQWLSYSINSVASHEVQGAESEVIAVALGSLARTEGKNDKCAAWDLEFLNICEYFAGLHWR